MTEDVNLETKLKDASFKDLSLALAEIKDEIMIVTAEGSTTMKGKDMLRLIALMGIARFDMILMYKKAIKKKSNLVIPDPENPGKFLNV
jgi:hypothetical protein